MAMLMATDWPGFGSQPLEARSRLPLNLVQGGCSISGLYDLEPIHRCFLNDELKLNVEEAARNSPLHLAPGGTRPLLLAVGGDEGPEYLRQSEALAAAWRRHGIDVEVIVMPGQNHLTMVDQLSDPDAELSRLIQRQLGL